MNIFHFPLQNTYPKIYKHVLCANSYMLLHCVFPTQKNAPCLSINKVNKLAMSSIHRPTLYLDKPIH